jgi:hypothetical protein
MITGRIVFTPLCRIRLCCNDPFQRTLWCGEWRADRRCFGCHHEAVYGLSKRQTVQHRLIEAVGNDLANKLAVTHLSTEDLGRLADVVLKSQNP